MSTGLVAVGGALRSPVSVVEPPRSSFRGPVVSTDLPPQQSSTAHLSGERGTGRVSKWRPHHCPRLATARSPPPRQCISGSTPSKRRCASQGRDCRCAWVMAKRVGVANPASAHAFVAKTTPPPPRRPPFSARHGVSHRPNHEKVLPPPPDFVSFAHVLHSQLLQAHPLP